jgi:hypothetical protein
VKTVLNISFVIKSTKCNKFTKFFASNLYIFRTVFLYCTLTNCVCHMTYNIGECRVNNLLMKEIGTVQNMCRFMPKYICESRVKYYNYFQLNLFIFGKECCKTHDLERNDSKHFLTSICSYFLPKF